MDIRMLLAFLLFPLLLLACAKDATQIPADRTSTADTGGATNQDMPTSLSITYEDGSVFSVQDSLAASTTIAKDGGVLRVQERRLSADEQAEFTRLIKGISTLDGASGGTTNITILDAGKTMSATIDMGSPPAQLKELVQWAQAQEKLMEPRGTAVGCTDPRPQACAQIYDPVCGSDGKTYDNGCAACASRTVRDYTSGTC